ncbi:MAG: gamma-glutamylcyclotransferase [Magnetospirillum sp.]|nr:gamma-glutamylcyclotransferase [Magnetospirillum sp.]
MTVSCKAQASQTQAGEGAWVYAYGSLMWRPDFAFCEARAARLAGWHRAMCILSTRWRGCEGRPGLVLGLDRGGSCLGRAFRVSAEDWPGVQEQLHAREMSTGCYRPCFLPVRLDDGRRVPAYAFVARRDHWQYWRGPLAEAVALIRQGVGSGGRARDYLADTVAHIEALGIREGALHALLRRVDDAEQA